MIKLKRLIPYLAACLLLAGTVLIVSGTGEHAHNAAPDKASTDEAAIPQEMRGIWVTYMTLDVENEADKEDAFRQKIDSIVGDAVKGGFNTLIVQVRPFCDAIYPSAYYPWSHIISGTQGEYPGFDPLQIICEKCGAKGLRVHAWVNPYRISTASTPPVLCEEHPYRRDSSIGVEINGETYLNPASKKARELIKDGVIELLENYAIDGVQFDDYFYPENCGDFDAADYAAYTAAASSPLSLADYRKENVNKLIREVYQAVHSTRKKAVFGISPQGNLPNNEVIYADVTRWCSEEGYADYICPQLYFSLDNPALRYEDALQEWLNTKRHSGLKLYAGLAGYKAGSDADEGTWLDNSDILKTEAEILRKKNLNGFILYSYDSMTQQKSKTEINNLIRYLTEPTQ